ncbi:exodeoxyribonuclease VIII [Enterobacter bugandensis]|uniref:Exodeoxyribonuclease VIII n=1 Tax=Enterobacter bugandensis TaxID=881260 RepID=A0AA42TLR5_9ENTR|nr:exodeoxyribonuclease VIII [Enterobacter bugandensis]MDH1321151.1 exodeoxyribonuclease VIII [Enterobacter bugandensis]
MSKYIGCWFGLAEAAEENGEMRIAHAFDAVNDKQAKAKATLLFMEAFPDADDSQFEFRIYAPTEGIPCPAEEWDETFLFDHEWDNELGHPVAVTQEAAQMVEFDKLSGPMKAAVLVKFMTTDITKAQLPAALELLQDEASTFPGHIVEAVSKMPAIMSMYPERIIEAINHVVEKCPVTKKWPEIKAVLAGWQKEHEEDRKDGAVNSIDTDSAEPSAVAVPRPYKHTFETLDVEIASALWAGDVDPNAPQPSITRLANGIIKEDREDFKRWSIQLRTQPNILKYDRPTIFGVVRNVPAADTYHFPESHKQYITGYLKTHGKMENEDDETEQNTAPSTDSLAHESSKTTAVAPQHNDDVSTTGTVETAPPVERTGPFYYRSATGDKIGRANKLPKLQEVIAQGCVEISQEEYQARKTGTYLAPQNGTEKPTAQPEVKKIANGVFSVDNLMAEQPKAAATEEPPTPSKEVEKVEVPAAQPAEPSFQSIGAALENDLAGKGDNMKIWRSVMRTDPRYTKDLAGAGFEGTSINAEYMVMRATEIFGPIGTGWGFEVMEDRMLPGAPMSEAIYEDKKFVGNRLLRDGDGTLITEKNHSIKIKFWYAIEGDIRGEVEAYGATKYLYKTKNGITCDGEAQKKSLTDAIKKALSLLGFSADVWLGLYDQAEYKQENATEFAIKNASEKAEDVTRLRNELDEKLTRVANTIEHAVSTNEAKKVFDTLAREVEVHRKAAEAKGDTEHAKYLSGRLRRLTQIKDQRIKTLTENQEQSA